MRVVVKEWWNMHRKMYTMKGKVAAVYIKSATNQMLHGAFQ